MTLRVGVVTVGRSDYGIYVPVLRRLQADKFFDLRLIVGAAHLEASQGSTLEEIEGDGFAVTAKVPMPLGGDTRADVAYAMGAGVREFASAYERLQPDLLVLIGDRYEMLAAAVAAVPFTIPMAHIHGGELTFGAMDDAIRHAITKLSHLHFAATEEHAARIRQMGEEAWRVHVTGSPAIDSILEEQPVSREELEKELRLDLSRTLLVTYHPVTLEKDPAEHIGNVLEALGQSGYSTLFTYANADPSGSEIVRKVHEFTEHHEDARLVSSLGHRRYHGVQRYVAAMVGNSSSGLVEAASFRLPVVNIGARQAGRTRAANVIDTGYSTEEILRGIERAVSAEFRRSIASLKNPYGDGKAAERIVSVLKAMELGPRLLQKRFAELHEGREAKARQS